MYQKKKFLSYNYDIPSLDRVLSKQGTNSAFQLANPTLNISPNSNSHPTSTPGRGLGSKWVPSGMGFPYLIISDYLVVKQPIKSLCLRKKQVQLWHEGEAFKDIRYHNIFVIHCAKQQYSAPTEAGLWVMQEQERTQPTRLSSTSCSGKWCLYIFRDLKQDTTAKKSMPCHPLGFRR